MPCGSDPDGFRATNSNPRMTAVGPFQPLTTIPKRLFKISRTYCSRSSGSGVHVAPKHAHGPGLHPACTEEKKARQSEDWRALGGRASWAT